MSIGAKIKVGVLPAQDRPSFIRVSGLQAGEIDRL